MTRRRQGRLPRDDGWTLLADAPFDFNRRRASVLVTDGTAREIVTKGAPEAMLPLCTRAEAPDGSIVPFDAAARARLDALVEQKGRDGLRLLAVARRPMPADCAAITSADETDLVLVGCAAFADPPKQSAGPAVAALAAAGVRVKIVSGDTGPVVQHVVAALNVPAHGMLTGRRSPASRTGRWRPPWMMSISSCG